MRSDRLVVVLFSAALGLTGCATAVPGRVCTPVSSLSTPAFQCTGTVAPAPEPEPQPEPEPEPEPAPEPEPVQVKADKIELDEKIQFEPDSAVLLDQSKALLDEVAKTLIDHPELKKIQIEGHTDSQRSDAHNQKLSEKRAKAVKDYLVAQGVDKARLTTKGFGESEPIADNGTPEGRYENRRVVLRIVEQD